jgi:hypothetical protein
VLVALAWALPGVLTAAPSLKITVYGGTGQIGQRIVSEALNRGHELTVVVRDPSKVAPRAHLTAVRGDILDSAAVAQQIAGQDVVISAVRVSSDEGQNFYVRAGESLVAAIRSLSGKRPRLIVVGGAGSLEVAPGKTLVESMPVVDHNSEPYTQSEALKYYRTVKDVDWSFVSPSLHIEPGTRTGTFRVGGEQLLKDASGKSAISMEDFAVALINEAETPQHVRQHFTVGY